MNDLTLIVPAKKEKESLPIVVNKIKELDCKITISLEKKDYETINSLKQNDIDFFFQSGEGYGNSLREAISNCKTKYFCIFNADGSFDHEDISKMYNLIDSYDFVYSSRYKPPGGSEDDTIITFIGNKFFSFLGNLLFSLKINDILYTFLMGKTESFKRLKINSNDFRFCVELPIKMQIDRMKYTFIPSFEKKRIAGKKKVNNFKDGFLILIEMLKLFIQFKIFNKKIIKK